jgi:hypothetical protein
VGDGIVDVDPVEVEETEVGAITVVDNDVEVDAVLPTAPLCPPHPAAANATTIPRLHTMRLIAFHPV